MKQTVIKSIRPVIIYKLHIYLHIISPILETKSYKYKLVTKKTKTKVYPLVYYTWQYNGT